MNLRTFLKKSTRPCSFIEHAVCVSTIMDQFRIPKSKCLPACISHTFAPKFRVFISVNFCAQLAAVNTYFGHQNIIFGKTFRLLSQSPSYSIKTLIDDQLSYVCCETFLTKIKIKYPTKQSIQYVKTSQKRVELMRSVLNLTNDIDITSMVIRLAELPNSNIKEIASYSKPKRGLTQLVRF